MARQPNREDMYKLNDGIHQDHGQKSGFFARVFGWSREKTARHLVSLNDEGFLFYEDDDGRLFPFNRDEFDES